MGWVHRTKPEHRCQPPMQDQTLQVPSTSLTPGRPASTLTFTTVPGALGDLWRCNHCRQLWGIGLACDICDHYGRPVPHSGTEVVGQRWRPATTWQRFRHHKSGSTSAITS
jgi:hypothetical protein